MSARIVDDAIVRRSGERNVYFMGRWWYTETCTITFPEFRGILRTTGYRTHHNQGGHWFEAGTMKLLLHGTLGKIRIQAIP